MPKNKWTYISNKYYQVVFYWYCTILRFLYFFQSGGLKMVSQFDLHFSYDEWNCAAAAAKSLIWIIYCFLSVNYLFCFLFVFLLGCFPLLSQLLRILYTSGRLILCLWLSWHLKPWGSDLISDLSQCKSPSHLLCSNLNVLWSLSCLKAFKFAVPLPGMLFSRSLHSCLLLITWSSAEILMGKAFLDHSLW